MSKLLILADDFTGAMDTGVQLAGQGIDTKVVLYQENLKLRDLQDTPVLVVDTETRIEKPQIAEERIRELCVQAKEIGIEAVYKKTDSALRGNIGAELKAALQGFGSSKLFFVPAYLEAERTTEDGIQYWKGVPVHETPFGKDKYNPLITSTIREMIEPFSEFTISNLKSEEVDTVEDKEGFIVFDAKIREDLNRIAKGLKGKGQVFAGCAGFAPYLKELLELPEGEKKDRTIQHPLVILCASLHLVTEEQIKRAVLYGAKERALSLAELIQPERIEDCPSNIFEQKYLKEVVDSNCRIYSTFSSAKENLKEAEELDLRSIIPKTLASIGKRLIEEYGINSLFTTGGDTTKAFLDSLGILSLKPEREVDMGTVLSHFTYNGTEINLITKSGGLESPDCIRNLI